jgi:hypothetical protein
MGLITTRGRGRSAPSAPPTILFHSTWDTATGFEDSALTDGGLWNDPGYCGHVGSARVMEIVTAATASSPRPGNVFRTYFRYGDGSGCGQVEQENVVAAGQSHYGRLFFNRRNQTYGGSIHNFSYNFVGDIQHIFFIPNAEDENGWRFGMQNEGTFPLEYWNAQSGPGTDVFDPPYLLFDYDVWYRYEWFKEFRSSGTRYRIYPRLYDASGTLVLDASDVYQSSTPTQGTFTLQSWYDAGNDFLVADAALHRNIGIGNEGRTGSPTGGGLFYDVADFAIGTGDWLGDAIL